LRIPLILFGCAGAVLAGCANGKASRGVDASMWSDAAAIEATCRRASSDIARGRAEVTSAPRTAEGVLTAFNAMMLDIDRAAGFMSLMTNVHPDKEVRTAAEACEQEIEKIVNDIHLDRSLYDVIAGIDLGSAGAEGRRFAEKVLLDFKRSGVDKDEKTRAALAKLHAEIVETGQAFDRAIREDVRKIELDGAADLEGLPKDFIDSHPPNAEGKIVITTNYPDFYPVAQYAKKDATRKAIYDQFLERGHPANETNLFRLLSHRRKYATTLGYTSWGEYMAEDKMVKNGLTIEKFIEEVAALARPRMLRDLEALSARKVKDGGDPKVQVWDRFYYADLVRKDTHDFDAQSVRPYFEFGRVTAGLMDLYSELFGVRFERDDSLPTWHASVIPYRMTSGGELVGKFYLDMHPREGKYGHAAMFGIQTGIQGGQIPIAALVCNFPDPSKTKGPALMDHGEVVTYFHELGHLVHHLLARGSVWANLAGIHTEWDFVEAPSQLLEEWAWDPAVLARFAKHAETGEPIPAEVVAKMKAASEFGKGIHVMRQIHYSALSYYLHIADLDGLDLFSFARDVAEKYSPYPVPEQTHEYAGFGHLSGYSSMYYTYQWSLSLAKDIFTRFAASGLLDTETARAYRTAILMPGGSRDATDLVESFLGRPHNLDAYRRWLEEE
jgi:thimet oligopeptidase